MGMINGTISMLCALFSVLLIAALRFSPQWRRVPAVRPALLIMVFISVMLFFDGTALFWATENDALFNALETVSVVASFFAEWFFGLFVFSQMKTADRTRRAGLTALGVFCCTGSALYIVNCFYPFLYDFRNERYLSEVGLWSFQTANFAFFALFVFLLLFKGGELAMRERVFLSATVLLPLTSLLWDSLFPGLTSRYFLVFLAMAANYIRLIFMMTETAQERIDQLELKRIRATLERIKPHYIYNVLASIYYLCDVDTGVTKDAIALFSNYLRGIFNLMKEETTVPFKREMQIVRNYVELEQMRFGDRITVMYAVEAEEFEVPPFTVQPLVENSVRHGAEQSEVPGQILIASRETEQEYRVIVSDNFEGFESAAEEKKGATSATDYIREILEMTVGGTLTIRSVPGKGTVSIISIPKNKKNKQMLT